MMPYLFEYLDRMDVPGAGVMRYISTRTILGAIASFVIAYFFGNYFLNFMRKYNIKETVRTLGLPEEELKANTPTMGGVIIVVATLFSTLLFTKIDNPYIVLFLVVMSVLAALGIYDDWIKVVHKNKKGVSPKVKMLVQVLLGIYVAVFFTINSDIKIKVKKYGDGRDFIQVYEHQDILHKEIRRFKWEETREFLTTIPFVKENEFNYRWLISWLPQPVQDIALVVLFALVVTFIMSGVSNASNLTDGLDGLCAGVSIISIITLAVFAYVSGNSIIADYLGVMYIPYSGEIVVFLSILGAACMGFLWFNAYPAQIFMGDTGSLVLGGLIALSAIVLRKEILLPLIAFVFLIETLSVIIQVWYFKYTRRRYGEGRRVFLMAPLHHHFQKKGWKEPKIVFRFWIISIISALFSIILLKLR